MIFDVEPLDAPWRSSGESLDQGIARIVVSVRANLQEQVAGGVQDRGLSLLCRHIFVLDPC